MANNAKDLQLRELKDSIFELNKLIRSLQETVAAAAAREEQLRQERDNLKEQVDYLTKKLFGKSSEKGIGDFPGQMNLFDEAEALQAEATAAEAEKLAQEQAEEKPVTKRKNRKSNEERFNGLPVEKVYLEPSEEDRVCQKCGSPMEKIGTEFVRREIHVIPPKVTVIEYYSVNYGCPACKEGVGTPYIIKGKDGHPHMVHGMASASTVAWIMYQKFCNGLPLYRQEQDLKRLGADISRATLANWVIANASECFRPMYEYFRRKLLERDFVMADETPVQVLHEPERRAQTKSYMWLFRSGEDGGPPIILYKYSPTRAGDTAVDFLEDYSGYAMCDGYSGYNKLKRAKRTACWAHIRRYLIDAIPKGKQLDYSQPSVQGVMYVNRLFELEDTIKKKYPGNFDAIKKARFEKEKPVIEGFLSWLEIQHPVRNSRMDKAVTYIRNRIPHLTTYLEDGRCSFSNNLSENSIRPFVVGRKGWLFSDTVPGVEASALTYTMVEMAKANGVNVYHYLTYLLERFPTSDTPDDELEKLAPWNETARKEIELRFADL